MNIKQMLNKEIVIKEFIEIVNKIHIEYENIYLFGSRAEGQYKEDSDWDFFIETKTLLSKEEQKEIRSVLRMKFHDYFPFNPIDIIIKDTITFKLEKNQINTISNEVFTNGIKIT